jgi:hypothetical protein
MSPEHERHIEIIQQMGMSREVLVDVVESLQMLGGDRGGVDWVEDFVRRTAERLYCIRLGMWAQIDPSVMPTPHALVGLANHCWQAARILAQVEIEAEQTGGGQRATEVSLQKPTGERIAGERPH